MTDLKHPCANTCSGYQQGYEEGRKSMTTDLNQAFDLKFVLADCGQDVTKAQQRIDRALRAAYFQGYRAGQEARAPAVFYQKDGTEMKILGVVCGKCGHEESLHHCFLKERALPLQHGDAT